MNVVPGSFDSFQQMQSRIIKAMKSVNQHPETIIATRADLLTTSLEYDIYNHHNYHSVNSRLQQFVSHISSLEKKIATLE